jgi:hypothetical protein
MQHATCRNQEVGKTAVRLLQKGACHVIFLIRLQPQFPSKEMRDSWLGNPIAGGSLTPGILSAPSHILAQPPAPWHQLRHASVSSTGSKKCSIAKSKKVPVVSIATDYGSWF